MSPPLAIDGGTPVRSSTLPYGRQSIDEDDIAAVVAVLRSSWLTTGPKVQELEAVAAAATGVRAAVAVSNGTAALHALMHALGVGPGDEVIVPAMTFVASANSVVFQGARPVFADVAAGTLLIDPASVARALTPRTKAVLAVDYAGQPADYGALRAVLAAPSAHLGVGGAGPVALVADACHALGGSDGGRPVGSLADASAFSLHPVKPITTGEGGLVVTDDTALAERARVFRNHGITTDLRQREQQGTFEYDMVELGHNLRLSDLQCALGLTQFAKLARFAARREELARRYDAGLRGAAVSDLVTPLVTRAGVVHAHHLYVVQLELERLTVDRRQVFRALRAEGIGVNVHYIPVHLHSYYRRTFQTGPGLAPVAEAAAARILTLPLFPAMTDADVDDVLTALDRVLGAYRR